MLKKEFHAKNVGFEGFQIFLRAFKYEQKLEVWIQPQGASKFIYFKAYDFCTSSGILGPKRREGDLQIPEGLYHINHFNPESNFHLSLGINYPNTSDKILSDRKNPGSAIYIHGNCVTVGCIPVADDKIKELYILAVEARNNGQEKIPVHIFPVDFKTNSSVLQEHPSQMAFWQNLRTTFDDFEKHKTVRRFHVSDAGEYVLD